MKTTTADKLIKAEYRKVNDRLIKAINDLISDKKCKNIGDCLNKCKTKKRPTSITHIANYKQLVPISLLFELYKTFQISANHILFNEGTQKIEESKRDTIEDLIRRVSELERKIK